MYFQITRQPTIVVSPVGWESEMAGEGDVEADDEDGYTARALYDYQAAASDEISFDPDDIITNIVMVSVIWPYSDPCDRPLREMPAMDYHDE